MIRRQLTGKEGGHEQSPQGSASGSVKIQEAYERLNRGDVEGARSVLALLLGLALLVLVSGCGELAPNAEPEPPLDASSDAGVVICLVNGSPRVSRKSGLKDSQRLVRPRRRTEYECSRCIPLRHELFGLGTQRDGRST
jgi:hypothetical protein